MPFVSLPASVLSSASENESCAESAMLRTTGVMEARISIATASLTGRPSTPRRSSFRVSP